MAFLDTAGLTHLVSLIKENFLGVSDKAASASTADTATTATTASKLGSSTVGGAAKPIYISGGTAKACSSTVGDSYKPVYMDGGTLTECDFSGEFIYTDSYVNADAYGVEDGDGMYHAKLYVTEDGSPEGFPEDITFPVFFTSDTDYQHGGVQVALGSEGELYTRTTQATEPAISLGDASAMVEGWENDWVKYATEDYVSSKTSSRIPKSGDAGTVSTYYTVSEDTTAVNDSSPFLIAASDDITIENGTEGKAWVKIIYCSSSSQSITVGSNWKWMGNGGMTLYSYCVLVCYWLGSNGFIEYINTVSEGALVTKTSLAETLADYATTEYVDSAVSELSAG